MTNTIANKLQSVTNCNATITKFSQINPHWQEKIKQSFLGSTESVYLVSPNTIEALSAIVKTARQKQWQIVPCGSGSKLDWGGLSKDVQLFLSTQKCDSIIEHAVDDLTITVEAGILLADLQAKLKATNQFLPIDPVFSESATIGGILATADTGSLRQRYGGIRDLVLGISFVRGDGEIAKAGGRVVKNVAGYDLMKLFIGSYGTLGIISQVTLRTYPIPETSQTVVLTGRAEQIERAIQLIKNSSLTPTAADLVTASVAKKLGIKESTALLVRFQAIAESASSQTAQLTEIVKELAIEITTYTEQAEQDLWQQLVSIVRIPLTPEAIICKFGILPTEAIALLQKLDRVDSNSCAMLHTASGIGTLQLTLNDASAIQKIRTFCNSNYGFLSILTAPQEIKQKIDIWGYKGNALEMMKTIKNKFDPQNLFSSDRFVL